MSQLGMGMKSEYLNYPDLNQILIRIYGFAFYVTSDLQIFLMYGKINYFIIMKI
jgi:hypothetical protein